MNKNCKSGGALSLSAKNGIIIPELDNAKIRINEEGWLSVYDAIRIIGGRKNPRDTWSALSEKYPKVVGRTDNFKFPGRGQRYTPIVDLEGWLNICSVLPGEMGDRYREDAASLVMKYLKADITLANDIIQRNNNQEDLKWQKARLDNKISRLDYTGSLKKHGCTKQHHFINCTNAGYKVFLGGTKKQVCKERGIDEKKSFKDALARVEVAGLTFLDELSIMKMDADEAQDYYGCRDATIAAAEIVRDAVATAKGEDK